MINVIEVDKKRGAVTKRIDRNNDVNKRIASFLSTFYGYANPLIEYEVEVLRLLEPFDIAPKVLDVGADSYTMTYCGRSLLEWGESWYETINRPARREHVVQRVKEILRILKEHHIKHNDIYNENILIDDDGLVRVTDFTFCNFKGVVGIADLFPEIPRKYDFIFCARMTDETLYQVVQPIQWRTMRDALHSDLMSLVPQEAGLPGSHVQPGFLYHGLPFPEFTFQYHRAFSKVRIQKILNRLPGGMKKGLDVGCSIGGISFALQRYGHTMTGIDYDPASIAFARKVDAYKGYGVSFVREEFSLNYVQKMEEFDFVIWLSNWMWIAKKQGLEEAKKILFELSLKTKVLFFETAQGGTDRADSVQLDGPAGVEQLLRENTIFCSIVNLGRTDSEYHERDMFFCSAPVSTFPGAKVS